MIDNKKFKKETNIFRARYGPPKYHNISSIRSPTTSKAPPQPWPPEIGKNGALIRIREICASRGSIRFFKMYLLFLLLQ